MENKPWVLTEVHAPEFIALDSSPKVIVYPETWGQKMSLSTVTRHFTPHFWDILRQEAGDLG